MATALGMIAAGFAFAGSSKIVNTIFPNSGSKDYVEEAKRHNLAMEAYTKDKEAYDKALEELSYQEHLRDKNQKAAENTHNKSIDYIKTYRKELKPPKLEDYLRKFAVHDVHETTTRVNWKVLASIASVVGVVYMYERYKKDD